MDQLISLFNSGRYGDLEHQARHLLNTEPLSGFFWKVLGVALQMQGKDAFNALQTACNLLPDDAEANSNLGNALRDGGRLDDAAAYYRRALTLNPDSAETHCNLGNVLRDLGRFPEAIESFRHALQLKPQFAVVHYNLGIALIGLGHRQEAIASYQRAIEYKPDFAEAYNNLGIALRDAGEFGDAQISLQRALQCHPDYIDAIYNLGNVQSDLGRYDDAVRQYQRVVELRPDHAEALNNLGNALKDSGRLTEACNAYEAAIHLRPDFIAAHYSLSLLKTYSRDDSHLAMLERQLPGIAAQPLDARTQFWFALGKIREDLGLYDAAFAAYQEGNRLKFSLLKWDELTEQALFERVQYVFSKDFFASHAPPTDSGKAPIFIVGMPRSGTTLLEQILSSCPGVYGAGELTDMSDVVTAAMPDAQFKNFPEAMQNFSAADFKEMADQYIARIWRHAPDALHVIDKMPANFFYIGLIRHMLPNAKIIHAMRDPMDSCFSCFSRLFVDDNLAFSYDLETLGRYYDRYIGLMHHWHTVLPSGAILDLRYEDLVSDTEAQARRLLAYLDLPWDENCLAFHRNQRQVKTASLAQVRQPIYRTSMARWERFATHLSPLEDLVAQWR